MISVWYEEYGELIVGILLLTANEFGCMLISHFSEAKVQGT